MLSLLGDLLSTESVGFLIALALILFVLTVLIVVVTALFRADRRHIVDVLEAGANWLPWRPRRRNRR